MYFSTPTRTAAFAEDSFLLVGSPVFPQIAIAIGILTSNRGGGRRPTLGEWTWCLAGCHCSALWLGGRVTTNFGGVDVVPCRVPL